MLVGLGKDYNVIHTNSQLVASKVTDVMYGRSRKKNMKGSQSNLWSGDRANMMGRHTEASLSQVDAAAGLYQEAEISSATYRFPGTSSHYH